MPVVPAHWCRRCCGAAWGASTLKHPALLIHLLAGIRAFNRWVRRGGGVCGDGTPVPYESSGALLLLGVGQGHGPAFPPGGRADISVSISEKKPVWEFPCQSKVKLTFEQQSCSFQGREKQRNPIFTGLLCAGIYARLQL